MRGILENDERKSDAIATLTLPIIVAISIYTPIQTNLGRNPGFRALLLGQKHAIPCREKIPEIARGLGKGMREFKKVTNDIKKEFTEENTEIAKGIKEIKETASDIKKGISESQDFGTNISKGVKEIRKTAKYIKTVFKKSSDGLSG